MDDPRTLQLLKQADQGNAGALDILYGRDRSRLRRLIALRAPRTLLASADLDDLVQESYIEAHRQIADFSYQGSDSFFRWLATVALHRIKNLDRTARAEKRSRQREVSLTNSDATAEGRRALDLPSLTPGPKTLVVSRDGAHTLESALQSLTAADREVVILARFEGLSISEVAEQIGRTRNATALLLSRALRKLKDEIKRVTTSDP